MALEKISLMETYIIETLRNDGVTNSELLELNEASIKRWSEKYESFDFTLLETLSNNQKAFHSIVEDGYTIKFLTLNGLVNVLRLKFAKHPEYDFVTLEQGIGNLQLTEDEKSILMQLLSPNWTITSTDNKGQISIQPTVQV